MADIVDTYWSNMVWFGNPNGQNATTAAAASSRAVSPDAADAADVGDAPAAVEFWATYDAKVQQNIILAVPTQMQQDYFSQQCDFWDRSGPSATATRAL